MIDLFGDVKFKPLRKREKIEKKQIVIDIIKVAFLNLRN